MSNLTRTPGSMLTVNLAELIDVAYKSRSIYLA